MYITQIDIYTLIFFHIHAFEWLRVFMKFGNLCAVLRFNFRIFFSRFSIFIASCICCLFIFHFALKKKFFFLYFNLFSSVLFVCNTAIPRMSSKSFIKCGINLVNVAKKNKELHGAKVSSFASF